MTNKKSKIVSLSIIMILLANLNLLAQEESKTIEEKKVTKSTIVGSVLKNAPNRNYDDKSIGGHLSYRHTFSPDKVNGINFNAGYINYKDNEIAKNDYMFTIGSHTNCKIVEHKIKYNTNTEIGVIYKDIEKNKVRLLMSFSMGSYYHIYKNIGLELNFKCQYNTYDLFYCGIGIGLSYSF